MMSRFVKKNPQTALVHAPRQAPQYISTVQPPCIVHRRLFLKIQMHCLIAIGPMTMTIVMARMAPPAHLHWAITLHKLRVEPTAYWHQVVYLPSI